MGRKARARQVTISHHDDTDSPEKSELVLRAWMLHRFEMGGFAEEKEERKHWVAKELEALRMAIVSLQVVGGGTGSAATDRLIEKWAPRALCG